MFQKKFVIVCECFCFFICLLFFAWCYYSLFDVATLIVILCSMLLLLLLPLAWCSLFNTIAPIVVPLSIPYLTLLLLLLLFVWWCCPLLDITTPLLAPFIVPCSMLLLHLPFLVNIIVSLLPLVRHYRSFCYSLVNVTTPLVAPCSMLLFLYSFILNTICSNTSMLCCDVDVFLLLTWCYCSYSSYFRLVFPPLIFCKCGRNSPNSNF